MADDGWLMADDGDGFILGIYRKMSKDLSRVFSADNSYSCSHSSEDNFLSIPSSISLRSILSCEIEYSSLLGNVRV